MSQYGHRTDYRSNKDLLIHNRPFQSSFTIFHKNSMKREDKGNSKISQLMMKIKSGTQSTVQSHMYNSWTHLKQSKSRVSTVNDLKQHIDTVFMQNNQIIQQMEENAAILVTKQKQHANWDHYYAKILTEVYQLQKTLEDIKSKTNSFNKTNLSIFRTVFQKTNMKASSIAYQKSRKQTLNSIIKDGSLLLSFKKNLQQDDGHITLKYSEQSANNKNQQKQINPFSHHHFQSFAKCEPINKKLFEPEAYEQFQSIQKDSIKGFVQMQKIKTKIQTNQNQVKDAINIYQELIDKFIQAIAQQKVQTDHQLSNLIKQINSQFSSLQSLIIKTKQINSHPNSFSRFDQLGEHIFEQLQLQKQCRDSDQKVMIRMMLEVVQYLQ